MAQTGWEVRGSNEMQSHAAVDCHKQSNAAEGVEVVRYAPVDGNLRCNVMQSRRLRKL